MNDLEDEFCEIKSMLAFVAIASQWEAEASVINSTMSQDAAWGRSYIITQAYERLKETMERQIIPMTIAKEAS